MLENCKKLPKKKEKKRFKLIYWVYVLRLIFRFIKYVNFKFYDDKHKN